MDYNLDELRNTCIKHGIKMVLLYGSQAMGNSNEKSDVDLGLLLKDDSYDFEDIIKDIMKVFNENFIRGERDGIHKCNPPKVNKSF
ncbi:nucleotidyltransferase domain-containing protein [Clostridium estertheticum]|uniref:nucleotidyltransferase domain-containing protein n=1 Tax=Clostridium estertheticum TaxID=238834 RepID=UPI001C0DFFC4|nr:nucleotidyltransferase domain-containing protein [Clostridium estertheticum]MBU3175488.1 nucleotidyltransferase domain-containing protein [Clostridium estertheticum]